MIRQVTLLQLTSDYHAVLNEAMMLHQEALLLEQYDLARRGLASFAYLPQVHLRSKYLRR
jgi:hypothetical protein